MGTAFEKLCKAVIEVDPVLSARLRHAQPWAEWAKGQELAGNDLGVDLVAELRERPGRFAAIQCKLRAKKGSVSKKEIDSFISASGGDEFAERLIIDTTERPYSANAEAVMRRQSPPVMRLGLQDLKRAEIDWNELAKPDDEIPEDIVAGRILKDPWPHQKKAIKKIVKDLEAPGTRGQAIMACGTGKTLVGIRCAERLAGAGGRVLVMVPSLSLMQQTVRAWLQDRTPLLRVRAFAVCSDPKVGKRGGDPDTADMSVLDLAWPATTDAKTLGREAGPDAPEAMTVVFSTYQSAPVIKKAQKSHGLPEFDLAVADEAHRTTGALIVDEDPAAFVMIHEQKEISAKRRLYMTATPKVYAESAHTQAGKLAATLCSMDDEDRFGEVLHVTRFGDAVERGLLSDYKVMVLAVSEAYAAHVGSALPPGTEITLDEQGRMLGCLQALAKTDMDEFPADDREPMRRAIAFCDSIKSSKRMESLIGKVAEASKRKAGENGALNGKDEKRPVVAARHVDGTFNAAERSKALAFLEEGPDNETRILTNARCLTEGVDVPALDAILFMHPRKNQIEVVQAIGRVMRKAKGKKLGYVILPVVVPDDVSPEHALDTNKSWRSVWQTLNAIRSHDERLDADINLADDEGGMKRVSIVCVADWRPPSDSGSREGSGPGPGIPVEGQASFIFQGLPEAIRAKIVEKCGTRRYWEDWAVDVARIAQAHIERIEAILKQGKAEQEVFEDFLKELRDDLNPEISKDNAVEMLAQHMVTEPVFNALFGDAAAMQRNPVSKGMETMLEVLRPSKIDAEAENLESFYDSVRRRVEGAATVESRQRIVIELYDKFFRKAFPKTTERLGIAYTPMEVVDFILHSVEDVLRDEFGVGLEQDGIHILDPFTGTGTFLVRLIQSGLIPPEQIIRKYGGDGRTPELHANEILLLAYYIAAVNIEIAFQDNSGNYNQFEGILLTDTFALEDGHDEVQQLFPDNSERRTLQSRIQDIRVIVGNPPWSVGQRSSADNNPNTVYPKLRDRIAETYAARSTATLKNSLYDSYKLAIRWASDRIGNQGVVAFVTNGSWIDGNVDSGVRACLAEEFTSIYVVNLRGKIPGPKEEGGNVFGVKVSPAISILVKNPNVEHPKRCRIRYHKIGDHLSREEKLGVLRDAKSIAGIESWAEIAPNRHHDWIGQRDETFYKLFPVGSKKVKAGRAGDAVFQLFSNGYKTGRDAYLYNFSAAVCRENARAAVDEYLGALQSLKDDPRSDLDRITKRHSTRLHWDDKLKNNLNQHKEITFSEDKIWQITYRPFVKQHGYIEHILVQRKSKMDCIFPTADVENLVICAPGIGSKKPFSVLMANVMPDLGFLSACQCFPRYRYEAAPHQETLPGVPPPPEKHDNITDSALKHFQDRYNDPAISKDDIFHYVYGVLHALDFRERYADTLTKELPRIPFAPGFRAFSEAGKALVELHLKYETGPKHPLRLEITDGLAPKPSDFVLGKPRMKLLKSDATLRISPRITLHGIPSEAHEYQVDGRSPLDWLINRYHISEDSKSGIVNDANGWFERPEDIVPAIERVVHLSVETVRIMASLPESLGSEYGFSTIKWSHPVNGSKEKKA